MQAAASQRGGGHADAEGVWCAGERSLARSRARCSGSRVGAMSSGRFRAVRRDVPTRARWTSPLVV